ncbi:coiled-coil domain-containing protein [Polynucleobacter acidiphobus]|uniref:hypothetical protein n=1 Tax=Polynucleobacter acidiphobus TaxID=556053 RepID=UPI000D33F569|nr:hypothetical protein [Polynucleobacter acidiphobus]
MVYRNIKREDFDETLQSLGNDPAILEHETQADHLQSKHQPPRRNQMGQAWSGLSALKESSLASLHPGMLIVGIGFMAILFTLVYLTIQIQELAERNQDGSNQVVVKRELMAIQSQIDDLHGQADEHLEQIMEFLEEIQAKRHISVKETKRSVIPDPDEVDLKKWRHLGVGKNKDGAFVMLHDGQQSRLFLKHAFAKPSWQITHFDQSQATLQGPGGKQVVLISP